MLFVFCFCHFNPRPPRGGRLPVPATTLLFHIFQSTPPARGATSVFSSLQSTLLISIHAPREGGDPISPLSSLPRLKAFQSTPPARGATYSACAARRRQKISIHAPREGGDLTGTRTGPSCDHFNPRPPRGGRQVMLCPVFFLFSYFNPRPPRGGRPMSVSGDRLLVHFNPRPPRGGRQQRCTVLPVDL